MALRYLDIYARERSKVMPKEGKRELASQTQKFEQPARWSVFLASLSTTCYLHESTQLYLLVTPFQNQGLFLISVGGKKNGGTVKIAWWLTGKYIHL